MLRYFYPSPSGTMITATPDKAHPPRMGGLSKNFLAPLYLGGALNLASIVSGDFLIPV